MVFVSLSAPAWAELPFWIQRPLNWWRPENFYQIDDQVYAHSRIRPKDVEKLHRLGVKSIVLFQGGDTQTPILGWFVPLWQWGETKRARDQVKAACERWGVKFFNPQINSLWPIREGDPSALAIHEGARLMADESLWPMVVSCGFAIDRCGAVGVTYKVKYKGMSYEEAMESMRERGHRGVRRLVTISLDRYLDKHIAKLSVVQKTSPHTRKQTEVCLTALEAPTSRPPAPAE